MQHRLLRAAALLADAARHPEILFAFYSLLACRRLAKPHFSAFAVDASGLADTHAAIEGILKAEVDPEIVVIPV